MTPFPESARVQFLLNGDCWITQIVLNATTMAFQFANGCRIDVGGALSYLPPSGDRIDYAQEWFHGQPILFHSLFEKRLVDVTTNGLVMTLSFENGALLLIHSDLSPYEAGAVLGPDGSRIGFYF
jgi:hypothetical protein